MEDQKSFLGKSHLIGKAFENTKAKLVPSINFDPNDGLNNLKKYWPLRKKFDGYIQYCNKYGSGQKTPKTA